MATEQYENTPVNNIQARIRAVADTPDGSHVEIASEDREMRGGGEDRSSTANETAVKNTGNPKDDKYDDALKRGPPCAISIVPLLTFLQHR